MPPDGGIVRPHDASVEPFFSKDKLDVSLSVMIFGESLRSNSFPRSHPTSTVATQAWVRVALREYLSSKCFLHLSVQRQ